jgi:hypothetical protein
MGMKSPFQAPFANRMKVIFEDGKPVSTLISIAVNLRHLGKIIDYKGF